VDFCFNLPNPSSRTMALESAQALTEMSTRDLLGGRGGRRVGLTTLPQSVSWLSGQNVVAPTSHNPMGLHGLLQGQLYICLLPSSFPTKPLYGLSISQSATTKQTEYPKLLKCVVGDLTIAKSPVLPIQLFNCHTS
jgi:hypothetical protein